MGPLGCIETSVNNHESAPRKNTEDLRLLYSDYSNSSLPTAQRFYSYAPAKCFIFSSSTSFLSVNYISLFLMFCWSCISVLEICRSI